MPCTPYRLLTATTLTEPQATEPAQRADVKVQAVPVCQGGSGAAPGSWPEPAGRSVPLQLKIQLSFPSLASANFFSIRTSLVVARRRERLRDAAHEVLGPGPGSEGTLSITAGPGGKRSSCFRYLCQGLKKKLET